jgi:SulP family sulfate permease
LTVLVDLTLAIAVGTVIGLALRLARGEIEPPDWRTPFRWGGGKHSED